MATPAQLYTLNTSAQLLSYYGDTSAF